MPSPTMSQNEHARLYLATAFTEPIRDPLWNHIYLPPGIARLTETREFQQLARIKQLGPTYLVYPGATHTRLNHSLGVFHIAKRIMEHLLAHQEAPETTVEGLKAFLAASLLHDLGHFPYTHSLKGLPLAEHEELTGRIILEGDLRRILEEEVGTEAELVAAIVDDSFDHPNGEELRLYRKLLSGSLDPDKLDYLNRDAYFCGVPYGIQDIDYVLSRLRPNGYDGVAVDVTGVSAVESILFSKYQMYRAVYWHRNVRVATAMIKKAVFMALREAEITPGALYGLDDELFYARLGSSDYPPLGLLKLVYNRQLYTTLFDIPYDGDSPLHRQLESMEGRSEVEEQIRGHLAAVTRREVAREDVVADLPENISFETSFPVRDGDGRIDFTESGTVFRPEVVRRFVHTLRRIRLNVSPSLAAALPEADWTRELGFAPGAAGSETKTGEGRDG
ncbi:MAG: HD domain-containing protein [Alkalispirochaetaceae bacterium]